MFRDLKYEGLVIKATVEDGRLHLYWEGDIHASNPSEALSPYLEDAVEFAAKEGLSIVSDFKGVKYMNSASIPPLIQLLRDLAEEEIFGTFIYDKNRKVQTASFKALDVIARRSKYTKVLGEE